MITNKYIVGDETRTSPISGGRQIHTYRFGVQAVSTYEHEKEVGQNFHSLAHIIFGDDSYWWVLMDLNKVSDPFRFKIGERITLPKNLAKNGRKRIF